MAVELTSPQLEDLTKACASRELAEKLAGKGVLAGATIAIGADVADSRAITIQLTDGLGNNITERHTVMAGVYLDANGDAPVVTGGSTGIVIGTDGMLFTIVAKKLFQLVSEADGDIDLTWTDTGTEVAYLGLHMPNGQLVMSGALTNDA